MCLDACSDTWEEEFFDNLGQADQGKEQDEEAILSLEDIQLFLESRGRLQDAMQVGNFMDNLSAVQIATADRPLFMISFNSNSSLFSDIFCTPIISKETKTNMWHPLTTILQKNRWRGRDTQHFERTVF